MKRCPVLPHPTIYNFSDECVITDMKQHIN
uniref:Uncharacterized protein n=1 Tax=Ciona intestinalis TaxID=7719 RepID=H2Y0Y3_CIOIN